MKPQFIPNMTRSPDFPLNEIPLYNATSNEKTN